MVFSINFDQKAKLLVRGGAQTNGRMDATQVHYLPASWSININTLSVENVPFTFNTLFSKLTYYFPVIFDMAAHMLYVKSQPN